MIRRGPFNTVCAVAVLLLPCLTVGCGGSSPPASSQAPQELADRLDESLSRAETAAEGVRRWLIEFAADATINAQDLVRRAEEASDEALQRLARGVARSVDGRTGLFLHRHSDDDAPRWRPVDDGETLPERIVLLVHGLDEPGDIWDDLAPALARDDHTIARFDYPNDQAVARSADLLLAALERLKRQGARRIDIVAHSMGGLIARDALTRPERYDGEASQPPGSPLPSIDRLIMAGTPHHGAPLADVRILAEVREQLFRWIQSDDRDPHELLGFLADGGGEAGRDLKPGSDFLMDLNSRPTPRGVAMTCIVGEMAPDDANRFDDFLESDFVRSILGARAERAAEELRTLTNSLGDGVVPVASAELAGVEDVVRVHANHRTMLRTLAPERLLTPITGDIPPPPAIRVIRNRLASDPRPAER